MNRHTNVNWEQLKTILWLRWRLMRNRVSSVRLYPVQLQERRIDGVTFQPSTKLIRIEE